MAGALTAAIAAAFAGSAAPSSDQYFEYTTLLLPGNGTNGAQNNTFLDGSTNNFTITRNGNTTQGTFSPFSQTGWGNYFGGDGNYLSSAYSADFSFSTGEFSIECWANVSDAGRTADANKYGTFVSAGLTGSSSGLWDFTFRIVGGVITEVTFGNAGVTVLTVTSQTITLNQWHHFVVCRSGSTFSFFVDGTRIGTTTYSTAVDMNASGSLRIAALAFFSTYQNWVNGYISDLRIIKGSSAYNAASSSITVPTTPLTSPTNTKLLTCQSNRFIDANTQVTAKTITLTGSPRVVAFSPFNPTASWSAATYGGSGYFDGNGDYLSAASNAAFGVGSGDFTIELWVYLTANFDSTGRGLITAAYDTNFAVIGVNSGAGNKIDFYVANTLLSTGTNYIALNTWTHLALVRSSGTTKIYFDGVEKASSGSLTGTGAAAALYVGTLSHTTASVMTGYLSSTRLVKGTAVYTGAFTPPSLLPLTNAGSTSAASYPSTTNVNTSFASSATSLLLNFTNAGIYDATSKNDLETVGNAQISTTQSKWGGGSMYFDGTGDYLKSNVSTSDLYGFGGDFAIELWLYRNATGQTILVDSRPTGGGGTSAYYVLYVNTSNVLSWFVGGSVRITGTTTISNSTWYHIAIARSGSSTKMYLNGTQEGSTYTDSTALICASGRPYVGADANDLTSNLNGYIDDLRITKGNARGYTGSTITVPTAPFPVQ